LNYFDEKEIHPLCMALDNVENITELVEASIRKFIGKPHNYGPTADEIVQMKKKQEDEQVHFIIVNLTKIKAQLLAEEEKVKREKEEQERYSKSVAEWVKL
jgi:adenylate kinase